MKQPFHKPNCSEHEEALYGMYFEVANLRLGRGGEKAFE
jgi:hypothetical protein